MMSDSKNDPSTAISSSNSSSGSPTDRLMRKRLAARLRQQRCRARKKELSLAQRQREQQDTKDPAHGPAPTRRPILVPRNNHGTSTVSRPYVHQSVPQSQPLHKSHHMHLPHRPHQPHQPHQPHRPHPAHQPQQSHLVHRPRPPHQSIHILPPLRHHQHQHPHPGTKPHYTAHRPVRPLYMTEPPSSRMQSIGSVVSFDDGSCPVPRSFENNCMPPASLVNVKQEQFLYKHFNNGPAATATMHHPMTAGGTVFVPTVSPTMSSKNIVELENGASMLHQVPNRSPTKEETAIDAMLSLRSASFGA